MGRWGGQFKGRQFCRGDRLGGAVVSPILHQLLRSGAYAAGSQRLGRSYHHLDVDPDLCRGIDADWGSR